jgi:2'-deoxynucleoside 5'-phosphate N-hydrolase
MIKIYFAGSITGGRDDQYIYFQLIDYLKTKGKVLTEHIADPLLKDSGEIDKLSSKEIFQRDVSWIKEADVVFAEVTQVSLGVGYELGLSESLDKKIICLYRSKEGKRLSAMISGNDKFLVKEYQTIDQAKSIIDDYFKNL